MSKMPIVETIANFDAVLELLTDPDAMASKLGELKKLQDYINEKLEEYGEIKDLESEKSRVHKTLEHANATREEAVKLKEIATSEANQILRVAEEHAGKTLDNAKSRQIVLEALEKDLTSKERDADFLKVDAAELKAASELEMKRAVLMMEQATSLQIEYQGKLDRFAEIAKGG